MNRPESLTDQKQEITRPKGFDDFNFCLGDEMRGERATMGKSVLEVQEELKIQASYIIAIEQCNAEFFEVPSFVPGYVRSYARYLNIDPERAYEAFCRESGFSLHFQTTKNRSETDKTKRGKGYARRFRSPSVPNYSSNLEGFAQLFEPVQASVSPRAIGSTLILLGLVVCIGFGGWTVLKEIQQVQVSPSEQSPFALIDIEPAYSELNVNQRNVDGEQPNIAVDRLYRRQALDVPVLVPRDEAISRLDPAKVGVFARSQLPTPPVVELTPVTQAVADVAPIPSATNTKPLRVLAVRPSWMRVTTQNGETVFEGILESGQAYVVPKVRDPQSLRVGESGAVYFDVAGRVFGPVGARGTVTSDLVLSRDFVTKTFSAANKSEDDDLSRLIASNAFEEFTVEISSGSLVASSQFGQTTDGLKETDSHSDVALPQVLEAASPGVRLVAVRRAWVRVTVADNSVIYEGLLARGEGYEVPITEIPAIAKVGDSGAVYFEINGRYYGPVGEKGRVTSNVVLSADTLRETFPSADITKDDDLARWVSQARATVAHDN
ncbi:MAG: DUF4115 domain-containing protein [Aestuariivita sp.]|nr:DUF4115 domain-containing protein [Aestuariivita sp.]MCY4201005.1 DUF4115 domain-containing protein [Aestuariivita sp.]MCY4287402.1 DUF4115 domain-containing protein [Aestuariivita sp.]MCY4347874.1 DUF4115 domain-containing protein [Aestuariivita sp.]